jgi:hypothetical protein
MNEGPGKRRGRWRQLLLLIAVGAGATFAGAGTADATIFERFEYAETEEADFPLCGIDVHYESEWEGRVHIREGKGDRAGAFFLQDNYSGLETITNPENGKFLTISHDGVFKEIKATPVGDDVFEFVDHEAGQPFVVRDMDGKVVLRDRGLISWTYLFDTGGDEFPGGEYLELLDVRVSGPHPGFFLDDGDECPTVIELLT